MANLDPNPMQKTVYNLYEAKTQLSALVDRAAAGEEVIIAKNGQALARLTALGGEPRPRKPGGWEGRVRVAEDFDAPLPDDLLDAFDGRA